ncbi:MAG: hypothetical protein NZO58_12695, partial [Gemmataceae bacterium]|nr:hypothetical protein [Gemmataceae bacterium]
MAEDRLASAASPRPNVTKLLSTFWVALHYRKLALAAAGIVSTAVGWWLLAVIFYTSKSPEWKDFAPAERKDAKPAETLEAKREAYRAFRAARQKWRLLHELAGPLPDDPAKAAKIEPVDVAAS